jgi:DNA-binding MarR family transcriptional regulator
MLPTDGYAVILVFLAITIAGVAGGIGGALLKDSAGDATEKAPSILDNPALSRSIVLGVLAAYVVPLFLVLAAPGAQQGILSQLLHPLAPEAGKRSDWWSHLFVLMGFCIVAALAAQNFLTSVSQRVLADVREAKRDAEKAAKKADQIDQSLANLQANPEGHKQRLGDGPTKVLQAFLTMPGNEFSSRELVAASGLTSEEVGRSLEDLRDRGLLEEFPSSSGDTVWSLSGGGKTWLRFNEEITQQDREILRAMRNAAERRPNAESMSRALSAPRQSVEMTLDRLRKLGLVEGSKSVRGGWRLRSAGRDLADAGVDSHR